MTLSSFGLLLRAGRLGDQGEMYRRGEGCNAWFEQILLVARSR